MKIQIKRGKDCKVQMTVEVDADRVESRYGEVLREFQKAAKLPGFRDGKAPKDLVERHYKGEAREEVLKSLIPEVYHQSVQSEKVSPVCLPKISGIEYERGQKLSFQAEFEEEPDFTPKNYKGLPLKRESAEVSAEDEEKGVQSLLESRATFEEMDEVRPVAKGDFILVDIEVWQNGKYVPGRTGVLLFVESGETDDFEQKIIGSNTGDTREISRGGQPYTRVTVKGLRKKLVPQLNDEFAKTLGKETAQEVREAVRKELAQYKHEDSVEKMKQELFQKLLKDASFVLPPSLVQKQRERLLEQARRRHSQMGASEEEWREGLEELGKDFEQRAVEQVRLYFILQRIAEMESIELDETELHNRLKGISEQSGRPIDEVRQVFEEDLRESLREKKTVDFLIANAKFVES